MNARATIRGLFRRAVLVLTTEAAAGLQRIRVAVGDEVEDDIEHAEPYGLATRPPVGASVFMAQLGGDASAPVVLAACDGTYRPTGLSVGNVALYDATGKRITLSSSGIQLGAAASLGVARTGDAVQVTIPANTFGTHGPVVVTGSVTGGSTVVKAL